MVRNKELFDYGIKFAKKKTDIAGYSLKTRKKKTIKILFSRVYFLMEID